jgi:hypothetical protein
VPNFNVKESAKSQKWIEEGSTRLTAVFSSLMNYWWDVDRRKSLIRK